IIRRLFFFFQAEDGIRDDLVTGVQTCALPISALFQNVINNRIAPLTVSSVGGVVVQRQANNSGNIVVQGLEFQLETDMITTFGRSEERRVGKESRARRSTDKYRKNRS